jgi:hypothetical protein
MTTDTIDGYGFEDYSPYRSKCAECVHFDPINNICKAFPGGIPAPYLQGDEVHDKIVPGQVGEAVLTIRIKD